MKAVFSDLEDYSTSLDGATVHDRNEVIAVVDSARERAPFVCQLVGENGYMLTVGIGKDVGCVQHSPSDGDVPYLMAVAPGDHRKGEYVEFLMGNTPTPFPRRNCLPLEMVKEIAAYFVESGERWSAVSWEEV
jgi:hypothetical protein